MDKMAQDQGLDGGNADVEVKPQDTETGERPEAPAVRLTNEFLRDIIQQAPYRVWDFYGNAILPVLLSLAYRREGEREMPVWDSPTPAQASAKRPQTKLEKRGLVLTLPALDEVLSSAASGTSESLETFTEGVVNEGGAPQVAS